MEKEIRYKPASRIKVLAFMAALFARAKRPVEAQGHLAELTSYVALGGANTRIPGVDI